MQLAEPNTPSLRLGLLQGTRRVVIKIGTAVFTRGDGTPAHELVRAIINDIKNLRDAGKEVIVVTSGAIALGALRLGIDRPKSAVLKQACAAVGQSHLMAVYGDAAEEVGMTAAQILVSTDDFADRLRYLSLRNTVGKLISIGVLPIVNENDTTTAPPSASPTHERNFDDNDRLSALVASKIDADLLMILTDVGGLYTADPQLDPSAEIIPTVESVTREILELGGGARRGRGGMKTKLEAAKVATRSGCTALIVNGKTEHIVRRVFAGEDLGTLFSAQSSLSKRKRWIAFAASIDAAIVVNEGARRALIDRKASLLPVGVQHVRGSFNRGEVVSVVGEDNEEFARGIVNYPSDVLRKVVGLRSDKIVELMDMGRDADVISRDDIALLGETS